MPASDEWFVFHLTPNGWARGTEKLDNGMFERPIPEDRVLTVVRSEYIASSYSRMQIDYEETFNSGDASIIAELKERFGNLPPT